MSNADQTSQFPPQIKYIVGNEACERFSFYGMRSILVVFMTTQLMMPAHDAKAVYHLFVSGCYLLPILGAFISDRLLGKYRTILYLSLFYCLGHLTLALWETQTALYCGLALIALGSGGIKPCVSAHVGDQFNEGNNHLMKRVFDLFYWSINFGSFFSTLLIPFLLKKVGPSWAFGIPGILMGMATFVFWMGRSYYVHVPPTRKTGNVGFTPILFHSLMNLGKKKPGEGILDIALGKYKAEDVEAAKAVASVFKVFITVSVFWALFDQHGSSWVLQGQQMDLSFLGIKVEAAQMQALNPFMVMVLIPLFSYGIYPAIERMGIKVTPLRKMSAGMLLAAFSFVFVGLMQTAIDSSQRLSIAWQFFPYLIITSSEVMVSITGLEFAYTQAPRSMKSTLMSFWLLTVFAGNLLDAYIAQINKFTGSSQFFFFAGLMFAVALVFVVSAMRYRVRSFIESGSVGVIDPLAVPSNG